MDENTKVSNQVIAHEIRKALKEAGYDRFTARPWNIYEPDAKLWWIVPSTKWPAYQFGKLFLSRTQSGYRIGFNIEKGISETAGQILSSKSAQKLCLKPDWIWNKFISDLSKNTFAEHLEKITSVIRQPLQIKVQVADVTSDFDPSSKPPEGYETDHIIVWSYQDGKLTCLHEELKGEMRKYSTIDRLIDLKDIFANNDMDWLWVDLRVSFEVQEDQYSKIKDYALCLVRNYETLFASDEGR